MKYLKEYKYHRYYLNEDKEIDWEEDWEEEEPIELGKVFNGFVVGDIYYHLNGFEKTPVCFINYDHGNNYPVLCLVLEEDYRSGFAFIEWIPDIRLKPANTNLKDYIFKNKIVNKTIEAFKNPKFSSGGSKENLEVINKFKEYLLNDTMEKK